MVDYGILAARIGQLVALIVALVTLGVGAKRCSTSTTLLSHACDKHDISYGAWSAYNKNGRMNGLYWVFYSSLVLCFFSAALFILELLRYRFTRMLINILCGTAALLAFINLCICIYYSSGSAIVWKDNFDKDVFITSRSWIAACVFLYVALGFYILDIVIARSIKPIRTLNVNN